MAEYKLGDIVTASFAGVLANCKIMEVVLHAVGPVYEVGLNFDVTVVEPGLPTVLLGTGSSDAAILRSTDVGATWEPEVLYSGSSRVYDFVQAENGWVIAGVTVWAGGGQTVDVYVSQDYGVTWELAQRLSRTYAWTPKTLFKTSEGTLLMGTYRGTTSRARLWRSTDNGLSWTMVLEVDTPGTSLDAVNCMAESDTLLAISGSNAFTANNVVYQSSDDGATWASLVNVGATGVPQQMRTLTNGWVAILLETAAGPAELWISQDQGATWAKRGNIIDGVEDTLGVRTFIQTTAGTLLVTGYTSANNDARVWRSTDQGLTWDAVLVGTIGEQTESWAICEVNGNILVGIIADDNEIWRSDDDGLSYEIYSVPSGIANPTVITEIGTS